MRCMICGKNIIFKRNFSSFFKSDNYLYCDLCKEKYDFSLNITKIDDIDCIYFFKEINKIKKECYIFEESKIFSYFLNEKRKRKILFFNHITIGEKWLIYANILNFLFEGEVILITYFID